MFDAMINGRIDTEGLQFDTRFDDIEKLNALALGGCADISKISYAILPQIVGRYRVLDSGSALGYGNGPLLVSAREIESDDPQLRVVVPGEHTTANLLLSRIFPGMAARSFRLFSQIADAVASGEFDAGVLIHEGRFTYERKGLRLVADLGRLWESINGLPLPLGAIVVSTELPDELQTTINRVMRRSIEYAMANPEASKAFIKSHAQELEDSVISDHINMFVNEFSLSLGDCGRRAVAELTGVDDQTIFVR